MNNRIILILLLIFSINTYGQFSINSNVKSIEIYALPFELNIVEGVSSSIQIIERSKMDSSYELITDSIKVNELYHSIQKNVSKRKRKTNYMNARVVIIYKYSNGSEDLFYINYANRKYINSCPFKGLSFHEAIDKDLYSYKWKYKTNYVDDILNVIENSKLKEILYVIKSKP